MKRTPQVNQVNEFLEIASDFENPLELIREALSNSHDAGASTVEIEIESKDGENIITIRDDGEGMSKKDLESFFDLGNSFKEDGIGHKGHGTKIYYKSDKLEINTTKNGKKIHASMENPWQKLNNKEMPQYAVEEEETTQGSFTEIRIHNFKAGEGLEAGGLTYNKLEHYIKWKTIGGSTKHYFDEDAREMDIHVHLDQEIDDSRDTMTLSNKFEFPEENKDPEGKEYPSKHMCRVYPEKEIEIDLDNGETTTLEIVGMVGGEEARNQLATYGSHKSQFGVWLAKDHIKVERVNDAVSSDQRFIHMFFVANCQDIELSANREKVRNKSGKVYQAVVEEISDFMTKVMEDPWYKKYLNQRRLDTKKERNQNISDSIEKRKSRVKSTIANGGNLTPKNAVETVAAVERLNERGKLPQKMSVAEFSPEEEVNSIIQNGNKVFPAALYPKMSSFLEEEKPLKHVEKFICWDKGDVDQLRELERTGYLGDEIKFDLENNQIRYINGSKKEIDILELSHHLN
ncbi:MAG: ATP-binding protein [Candidatus Nanohaloarchaea archaeon]